MAVQEALISPEVLKWARDRLKVTQEGLAKSANTKTEKIQKWESGQARPTFKQAQKIAHTLKIPFGYLYLSRPPEEKLPIPDRRIIRDKALEKPSPNFLEIINSAKRKQDWYREFLQLQSAPILAFIGSFNVNDDTATVAEDIRFKLFKGYNILANSGSWSDYFMKLNVSAIIRLRNY